jgi:hypothetical protein
MQDTADRFNIISSWYNLFTVLDIISIHSKVIVYVYELLIAGLDTSIYDSFQE